MKRLVALVLLALTVTLLSARAQQSADDQYVVIYGAIQQADTFASSGQVRRALEKYVDVQTQLKRFQRIYPDWNPKVVNYRLNYIAGKITEVTAQLPVLSPSSQIGSTPGATNAIPSGATADLTAQLNALHDQVQHLQADNTVLQSKLKEALTTQPTTVDARQFTQAQEQIRTLMKENELLKVSLAQGHGSTTGGTNAEVLKALTEANKKLYEQMQRVSKLESDNQALQVKVRALTASADAAEALRQENVVLKKQLASLKSTTPVVMETGTTNAELAKALAQIEKLQAEAQANWIEKLGLENRVQQLQSVAVTAATTNQVQYQARISELEKERDDLLAKLGEANKKLYGSKQQSAVAQIDALAKQVETLRARIAVDEAQAVPYTEEELALFKKPEVHLIADADVEKKSVNELPGGVAELVAEAQRHFAAKQFDAAEDDYLKILKHDQNNGLALANLATIELEQGKLDEADKHITGALAQSPNDAYNLSILGYLKFRQEKYDDALDALSRAAKLNPQNPEILNYLGVTLSHKGLRVQAETALRKALQLDPNYAAAHNNLAVIYVSQQPPLTGLARWHYQKALDAGLSPNAELEKILNSSAAPADTTITTTNAP